METKHEFRRILASLAVISGSALLFAACGGGPATGGSGAAGDTVRVSLASAAPDSSESVSTAAAVGPSPLHSSRSQNVESVWITIERMALVPGPGNRRINPEGEEPFEYEGDAGKHDRPAGFVVKNLDASVTVDLLGLSKGDPVRLPIPFEDVPPGVYGKIRLYFRQLAVTVDGETVNVKPKARYHLDIFFKDGGLVIPEGGTGGTLDVVICVVPGKHGFNVEVLRNPRTGAILGVKIRPVVFAVVSRDLPSSLSGSVESVDLSQGAFMLRTLTDGGIVRVEYDADTRWSFRDGDTVVPVPPELGLAALRAGASADVLGTLSGPSGSPGAVMRADDVILTFPVAYDGIVTSGTNENGWLPGNESFDIWYGSSFWTVAPRPDRATAVFDNSVPVDPPYDNAVVYYRYVRVRGYSDPETLSVETFWTTIGSIKPPPVVN
ncbi:MAG: DUF4382 domain-containing protein [Deltaproteobacteria bacterium]|nr:DUF4382 domain-containing protein [Deltaproteobacteria bacterium]